MSAYPHVKSTGVWDAIVDVAVVAQAHNGETNQSAHIQGEDGDEEGLHTRQVTVQQDGHKHNLPWRR